MTKRSLIHHRLLRLAVLVALVGALVASGRAADADGHEPPLNALAASTVQWVDGGDDSPCLNDDTGRALTALPSDKWCSPILGCYQADDGTWVLPSRSTGIWQGDPSEVRYADEINTTPTTTPTPTTPTPTTPAPTTPTPTTPAPRPPGPGPSPTPTTPVPPGSTGAATPSTAGGTSSVPGSSVPGQEAGAPAGGGPSTPAAPTLTASGSDLTATWAPHPDAEAQGVTGHIVEVSGIAPVLLDATATVHTFTGVPDGTYVAVVRAVNAVGSSPSSPPSASVTVGAPVASVVGTIQVVGTLAPGETVTVTGAGYARNVPDLRVELHSTPTLLGTVATDAQGGFSTTVTVPAVEAGDHAIVVLHDGVEVSRTPVHVVSAAAGVAVAATGSGSGPAPSVVGLGLLVAVVLASVGALAWYRRRSTPAGPEDDPRPPVTTEHVPAAADPRLSHGIPGVR